METDRQPAHLEPLLLMWDYWTLRWSEKPKIVASDTLLEQQGKVDLATQ